MRNQMECDKSEDKNFRVGIGTAFCLTKSSSESSEWLGRESHSASHYRAANFILFCGESLLGRNWDESSSPSEWLLSALAADSSRANFSTVRCLSLGQREPVERFGPAGWRCFRENAAPRAEWRDLRRSGDKLARAERSDRLLTRDLSNNQFHLLGARAVKMSSVGSCARGRRLR